MKKIYIPTENKEDWRKFLADPKKQWKEFYSAYELANCWENSKGFPCCISKIFQNSYFPLFKNLELLLAIPEYKVEFPGGTRSSQNDLFVLSKSGNELCTIMIEGKVDEDFGDHTVKSWLKDASEGKEKRLNYLREVLNLELVNLNEIRYQLLHRTASAIIIAENFTANNALMLVQSFSTTNNHFDDYSKFLNLYGITNSVPDKIYYIKLIKNIILYIGWVNCSI